MKNKFDLEDNAGLTVADIIEIEGQVTQVHIASEMLLELLHKKRKKYLDDKSKTLTPQELKEFFDTPNK